MPLRWAATATVAGTITFALDHYRVGLLAHGRAQLSGLQSLTLWTGHLLLAMAVVVLGLLGTGAALLASRGETRGGAWWLAPRVRALAISSVVILVPLVGPLAWAGATLASGPWISEQSFAAAIHWAPVVGGLIVVPAALWFATLQPTSTRGVNRLIGLATLAVATFAGIDHLSSPGLFPEFHLLLQGLGTIAAVLAASHTLGRWWRPGTRWTRIMSLVCGTACVAAPAVWFGMSPNTRSALVLRSPVARDWLATVLPAWPPTLLHEVLATLDVGAGRYTVEQVQSEASGARRSRNWNVVLVVADTLRADALAPGRPAGGTAFSQPGDTPRLDAWMERTYRFSHAYAAATETRRAMPTMFRSIEASDDPFAGVPLGSRMESLGVEPVGVVHRYFSPGKFPSIAALLDGFSEIRAYETRATATAIPQALEIAASLADRQFFLFVHLYTVHVPGFAGRVLGRRDGSRIEKYRTALRYLDGQFGALVDGLDEIGLGERTIVVFVGDHGEGLGDHGQMNHGPRTFEEDLRIPMAFAIPELPGGLIEETVGIIDVAPTLVDLLGAAPVPGDRGRSLLPLVLGQPGEPTRPYYFENNKATTIGVVVGHDKLIYERGVEVVHRFDVAADPDEQVDLYDPSGAIERDLQRVLVQFKPEVAVQELARPATFELLRARLDEIDPRAPGHALGLLVRLVAVAPSPELVARCVEIFEATEDSAVRLLIARHLLDKAPLELDGPMTRWLEGLEGTPDAELEVVAALARQRQSSFGEAHVAARLTHYATGRGSAAWEPWLRLIRPWAKPAPRFGPALATMLGHANDLPTATLELLLEAAAGLVGEDPSTAGVVQAAHRLLGHPEPRVRVGAIRTLGALGTDADAVALAPAASAKTEDVRVRRAATIARKALLRDKPAL